MTFKRTYSFAISNAARARGGRRGGLSRAKIYMETYTNVARAHAAPGPCAKCGHQAKTWLGMMAHYKKCIGSKSILHKISILRTGVE